MLEAIIACCLVIGGAFTLIGSIGLARLPDLFTRLHGPTKATTLGVGSILIPYLQILKSDRPCGPNSIMPPRLNGSYYALLSTVFYRP